MLLVVRVVLTLFVIFFLAFANPQKINFSFFWIKGNVSVGFIILTSSALGLLLYRWYQDFRQYSLLEVIKEYSRKVTQLEQKLRDLEKEQKPPHSN